MPRRRSIVAGIAPLVTAAAAVGATGEEIYRAKCSLCHDSGAAAAPRISDKAAWATRLAEGKEPVYRIALTGKPDTAMLPKGGFPELADAEVRAAVDYMLLQAGYSDVPVTRPGAAGRVAAAAPAPASAARAVNDGAITASVAEALRQSRDIAPPNAQVETDGSVTTVSGTGIKIETREGVVTLRGVVEHSPVVGRAEAIARSVGGVKAVDNNLISSSIFEHD